MTSVNQSDDFTQTVKRKLEYDVRSTCSSPCCSKITGGGQGKSLGEAAHITANSPGGPRYDSSLPPDERRSEHNGIWLCVICHTEVDAAPEKYTVALLREWKSKAIQRASKERGTTALFDNYQDFFSLEFKCTYSRRDDEYKIELYLVSNSKHSFELNPLYEGKIISPKYQDYNTSKIIPSEEHPYRGTRKKLIPPNENHLLRHIYIRPEHQDTSEVQANFSYPGWETKSITYPLGQLLEEARTKYTIRNQLTYFIF